MGVFGDLNEVKIIGNITQDIEVRHTPSGAAVTNFSVATNRNYKQGEEWKEEVAYHNIVVWGNDAQSLSDRARKGTRVFITGRLQTRSWEDQDGKKNYRTEIVAERIILLDRFEKGQSDGMNSNFSDNEETKKGSTKNKSSKSNDDEVTIDPDDLPF